MKRRLFNPARQKYHVVGGCKLPSPRVPHPMLKLKNYRTSFGPNPPSVAYNQQAMSVIVDLEGNDQYGDCVEAEEAHYIAVVTGSAGKLFSYTDAMTLAMYTTLTGFNPSDPSTDQGTDPIQCLNYFTQNPYADGTVNGGYVAVDATNPDEVQYAVNTFGNLKIWLGLPDSYINPFPSVNGFVWDVDPKGADQDNGHCIGSCGYIASGSVPQPVAVLGVSAQGLLIMTWGLIGTMTWAALAAYCIPSQGGGLAVRVTSDWLNAQGQSPTGLNLTQLMADFQALNGGGPGPSPTPPPTPPQNYPALQDVIDAITPLWPSSSGRKRS